MARRVLNAAAIANRQYKGPPRRRLDRDPENDFTRLAPSTIPTPDTPASFTATLRTFLPATVDTSWSAVSGVDGYNVYRGLNGGAFAALNGAPIVGTTYVDDAPTDDSLQYHVKAIHSGVESSPSNTVTISAAVDEYRRGRGQYFATAAMVSFLSSTAGSSEWSDPDTADWATASLQGNSYRRGLNWQVWKDAVLARNPALTYADLGVISSESDANAYDIAIYTFNSRQRIKFNYEALEHLLSMHKFVILQHGVPPITLERIRARSNVGTIFGQFMSVESVNLNEEFTFVNRGFQSAGYSHLLTGTRQNANGVTHVDSFGSQVVTDYALAMPQTAPAGHFLAVDLRDPDLQVENLPALSDFEDLYPQNGGFVFFDNTITSRYTGEAQSYDTGTTQVRTYANDPDPGRPLGTEIGAAIVNPSPFSDAQFVVGWRAQLNATVGMFTTKRGTSIRNLKRRLWGNCYYNAVGVGYTSAELEVPFFEYFWGQELAGQHMQTWATTLGYIQDFAGQNRVIVIAQSARTTDPQVTWLNSTGPGTIAGIPYGRWSDIRSAMLAHNATIIVLTCRGGTEQWLHWQTGCLPPEGF